MKWTLRVATEEDKEFLYTLNRISYRELVIQQFGTWDETWQRQYFEQKWSRTNYQIIDYSGKNIGAISKTDHDDYVFLNEIQLLPEFQGQGIGSALITQELERVEMMDIPMKLRVLKQNRQARKLYERLGFVVYGETETHFLMTSNVI